MFNAGDNWKLLPKRHILLIHLHTQVIQQLRLQRYHISYIVCCLFFDEVGEIKQKTTLTGFEPVRENPMDFKSIALTTRPQYLVTHPPPHMLQVSKRISHNMIQQVGKMINKGRKFFDIAANLTDQQFGNSKHHEDDRESVVKRALEVGCSHLLIAAGCLQDATLSYELCNKFKNSYCTIGVHPCRAAEPLNKQKYGSLQEYIAKIQTQAVRIKDKLVAIGQCGLDYDRLNYASKQQQLQVFPFHFDLAQKLKLPMYLHNRNTGSDFYDIVRKNRDRFSTGVVHSFTGGVEEVKQIVELDLYIGINGCSFKTQENLETLKVIPLDRIMLETDAPYCQIRNSHAGAKLVKTKFASKNKRTEGFVLKGRNEPCKIVEVLEVASAVLGVSEQELSQIAFNNSMKIFNCK